MTPADAGQALAPAGDEAALKQAYSCFPSGVVAVCRRDADGRPVGMSASAFTTVSLDPPLVSVCVRTESATWPVLREAQTLGVSVFAADQADLCRQLAGPPGQRFDGVATVDEDGGLFIADATAHLLCTQAAEYPAGDHSVVLLRIVALRSDPSAEPLVFHASSFRALEARRELSE